ncbi:MAG: Fic family protein [Bacteroidota bacterium]|nr:Fic family protein [Bacteroidota bacterium]
MNPEDFKHSTTGKLIKVGSGDVSYNAFIPNTLPPQIDLDTELIRTLSEADRALGELAGLGRTMANPSLLIRPFMNREAVLSSKIEGTQADISDIYAFGAGEQTQTNVKLKNDVREVLNYVRAMEYGLKRVESLPISLRFIRELHEHLMKNIRGEYATPGEFRKSQNWIGPPGCTLNEAHFVPPPVDEMKDSLDAFENYLHSVNEYPPLVRLALIHYQFEAIHPFLDGNGRIGRLLLTLLLVHWKLLPLPLLYLSAFFENHRDEYYNHLQSISKKGSWHDWLLFFLKGVNEQSKDAVVRAKQLQDLQLRWRDSLQSARSTPLMLGIADYLFIQPIVTATKIQSKFKVTHPTAMQALKQLTKKGIVQESGRTQRPQHFIAQEILKIVE